MPPEPAAITLSFAQQFELEKMNRIIDSTSDVKALQALAKQCFTAWLSQQATSASLLVSTIPQAMDYHAAARELASRLGTEKLAPQQ